MESYKEELLRAKSNLTNLKASAVRDEEAVETHQRLTALESIHRHHFETHTDFIRQLADLATRADPSEDPGDDEEGLPPQPPRDSSALWVRQLAALDAVQDLEAN